MASVTSLDQDMRKLRMDRYTPSASNEVRKWIEGVLGRSLPSGDLMDALKDGVALCELVNMISSPGVRYKASSMPFVQMENISNFLRACEMPPLSLPAHDRFLTVDLYDSKDPAQVVQCLAAFSRRANAINPQRFPNTIGAKSKVGYVSPNTTGPGSATKPSAYTTNSSYAANASPTRSGTLGRGGLASGGSVSSWSKRDDEYNTAPAWNIHQYGYMGGANQGNQGVAFGGRRQIVSQQPEVPSLAEKEKRLREKMEQQQRASAEIEDSERAEREAEEARARREEQQRWEEETRKAEEEERSAREEEERLQREKQMQRDEQEVTRRPAADSTRQRTTSDARLNGQFLSQYQASQAAAQPQPAPPIASQRTSERQRIAELERQLAEMRAHVSERDKLASRLSQTQPIPPTQTAPSPSALPPRPSAPTPNTAIEHNTTHTLPHTPSAPASHEDDWATSERDALRKAHAAYRHANQDLESDPSRDPPPAPQLEHAEPVPVQPEPAVEASDPALYQPNTNRTSRFLASNPAPPAPVTRAHIPVEAAHGTTAEVDSEMARRIDSQKTTKAGGWASKSLLEREMERERERQREWEEEQKRTADRARDPTQGVKPGQSWDVNQYGYTGGDSQNRGSQGIGAGRRQIIGPRPLP